MGIMDMVQKYGSYREVSPGEHAGPCPQCGGALRFRVRPAENSGKCSSCDFMLVAESEVSRAGGNDTFFDAEKLQRLISDTYSRVTSLCPKGAALWLDKNRPDAVAHLLASGKAVDAAYESGDAGAVRDTLTAWERYHLAAYKLYDERPSVIERQNELF